MSVLDGLEIVRRLSVGRLTELYLARPKGGGPPVVVKKLLPHLLRDERIVGMFQDEARLAALLDHPNVARVLAAAADSTQCYLVMEYVVGESLATANERMRERGGRVSPALVAWIGIQVCEALGAAHALRDEGGELLHLIHRDVTPANIALTWAGGVKLLDFGLARARGRVVQTEAGALRGNLHYLAPEQLAGEPLDHRVDVYGLGLTLLETLAGEAGGGDRAVAQPPQLAQVAPDAPPTLVAAIQRATAIDPADRFANVTQMQEALTSVVQSTGSDSVPGAEGIRRLLDAWLSARRDRHREALDTQDEPSRTAADVVSVVGGQDGPIPVPSLPEPSSPKLSSPAPSSPAPSALAPSSSAPSSPAPSSSAPSSPAPSSPAPSSPAPSPSPPAPTPPVSSPQRDDSVRDDTRAGTRDDGAGASVERSRRAVTAAEPDEEPLIRPRRMPAWLALGTLVAGIGVASVLMTLRTDPEPSLSPASPTPGDLEPALIDRPADRPLDAVATERWAKQALLDGEFERAAHYYRELTQLSPTDAEAHRGLGLAEEQLGRALVARRAYERYLDLRPAADDAHRIRERMAGLVERRKAGGMKGRRHASSKKIGRKDYTALLKRRNQLRGWMLQLGLRPKDRPDLDRQLRALDGHIEQDPAKSADLIESISRELERFKLTEPLVAKKLARVNQLGAPVEGIRGLIDAGQLQLANARLNKILDARVSP